MGERLIHQKIPSLFGFVLLLAFAEGRLALEDIENPNLEKILEQAIQPIEDLEKTIKQKVHVTPDEQIEKDAILSKTVLASLPSIRETIKKANDLDKAFFENGIDRENVKHTDAFGPHQLPSPQAIGIASFGKLFTEITKSAADALTISTETLEEEIGRPQPILDDICPFSNIPDCCQAATSRYRTIDGSCNNLNNVLWGRSFTPFERMVPAHYDNGVDEPRQTSIYGGPLPLARTISLQFHQPSLLSHLMQDLSHMTMEFGQFLSHDIQRNALSTGYRGSTLNCCGDDGPIRQPNCFAIEIPEDDPYYSKFNRRCMNFVRASPTPNLDCSLGQRQQLNQNTHYIDGSQIYGSDEQTSASLRTFTGGKLKTGADPNIPDLLPKDTDNTANCILPESNSDVKCFLAGDHRVNEHPALISLHTIFMREHNRIAAGLEALNYGWSDQILYDEARKIVGAMLQHITYNEYLPEILGEATMNSYGLKPLTSGYFNGYDSSLNAAIKNEFSTAAFRFGHSMVHDSLKYGAKDLLLKDVFFNPATLYDTTGGVDIITKGLTDSYSQTVDERLSKQLTRHLFERQSGFGDDLAAINIQRGRDHGIPFYLLIKTICNVNVSCSFHHPAVWKALNALYQDSFDIDLFPAGVSENPVTGGKIGPTFACIIAKQFEALKKGDRYYYENSGDQAFTLEQLDEIRTTTLSKVICRNTGISTIQTNAFIKNSCSCNPMMSCSDVSEIDYNKWKCGWSDWGPWTQCVNHIQFRLRTCRRHKNCPANVCIGNTYEVQMCSFDKDDLPRFPTDIKKFEKILDVLKEFKDTDDVNTAQNLLQESDSQDELEKLHD